MSDNYKITYNVDMTFCIDVTGSMGHIIDTVKANALSFYNDVTNKMAEKHKTIESMRVRVIAFRDYIADGDKAMLMTDFFKLPEQSEDFRSCVALMTASGGGDSPEDGLEALAYAIRSRWDTQGMKRRHVIVLWTDAATHELGFGKSSANYPDRMAGSFAELTDWWGDSQNPGIYMDQKAKRLILFAPNEKYWSTISDSWDNVIHYPSVAGKGLDDLQYSQIIESISSTI